MRNEDGEPRGASFETQKNASWWNILSNGSWYAVAFWMAIVILLIVIPMLAIGVSSFVTARNTDLGNSTGFTTSTTTSTNTTTTFTTQAPTTVPLPALVLTCPTMDISVPLGYDVDASSFGVTLTSGCPPTSLTFIEAVVGTIFRRQSSPSGLMKGFNSKGLKIHHSPQDIKKLEELRIRQKVSALGGKRLIFDDIDAPENTDEYYPSNEHAHGIVHTSNGIRCGIVDINLLYGTKTLWRQSRCR